MWYWVKIIEGLFLIPFIPLLVICWKWRGASFFFKCQQCGGRWLFLYPGSLRLGLCEKCFRQKLEFEPYLLRSLMYGQVVLPKVNPHCDWLWERVAQRVKGGRVLDVGCGTGYLLSKLNLPPPSLYGFDIASGAVKMAGNQVKGANLCVADAKNLPYRSDTFDYLSCTEVLEHVEGDEVAKECYRVLKPGGVAIITVPNGSGVAGKYMCDHVRFFTFQSIIDLLKEEGFEIVSGQKFGLYIPLVSLLIDLLYGLLRRQLPFIWRLSALRVPEFLSARFFIECRKPVSAAVAPAFGQWQ